MSPRQKLKARKAIFTELSLLDELRKDHRFQNPITIIKDESSIVLVNEKLFDSFVANSDGNFVNLIDYCALEERIFNKLF